MEDGYKRIAVKKETWRLLKITAAKKGLSLANLIKELLEKNGDV